MKRDAAAAANPSTSDRTMDHFARLGLPAALDLDPAALKAAGKGRNQGNPMTFIKKP